MTLPTTTRVAPVGRHLDDGYQTLIAFAVNPDISFWEKSVKPPGFDGGDPIDTTTMFNTTYRTMASRALKTMTGGQMVVAYDPRVMDLIVAIINVEGAITCTFSDGSTWDFYGFLQSFEPNDCAEGAQPEATVVFVPTNTDPDTGAEVGPNYKTASGTDTTIT